MNETKFFVVWLSFIVWVISLIVYISDMVTIDPIEKLYGIAKATEYISLVAAVVLFRFHRFLKKFELSRVKWLYCLAVGIDPYKGPSGDNPFVNMTDSQRANFSRSMHEEYNIPLPEGYECFSFDALSNYFFEKT